MQEVPIPTDPSKAIAGPLGSPHASGSAAGGPQNPCYIPQLTLPTRSFKQVNIKDPVNCTYVSGLKSKPPIRTLVSHCLQGHLGIHLVHPQYGMSYSDPLKFCVHGRGIHNLPFH